MFQKPVNPKGNQSWIFRRLFLKLKLQYFSHLRRRANSLDKTLILGKTEARRRRAWQRMGWFDGLCDSVNMSLSKLQEIVKGREAWHAAVLGKAKSRTWLSDGKTTKTKTMFHLEWHFQSVFHFLDEFIKEMSIDRKESRAETQDTVIWWGPGEEK